MGSYKLDLGRHKEELFGGKKKGLFDGRRRGEKVIGVQGLRGLDS